MEESSYVIMPPICGDDLLMPVGMNIAEIRAAYKISEQKQQVDVRPLL